MFEKDGYIRLVENGSGGEREFDALGVVEDFQVGELLVLGSDILFTDALFEHDTEIGSFESIHMDTILLSKVFEHLCDLPYNLIPRLSTVCVVDLEHVVDMEHDERSMRVYGEILEALLVIRKPGEMIDFLVERFI